MIVFENWLEDEIDVVALQEFADSVVNACVREFDEIYSKGFDVSIYIADDEQIRKINAEYRDADKSTDVLSFPMNEFVCGAVDGALDIDEETGNVLLGDIIISLPTCNRQADEYGHAFEREFAFLLSHGMMHLLGFDHIDDQDAKVMFAMQEKVLGGLGITRDM